MKRDGLSNRVLVLSKCKEWELSEFFVIEPCADVAKFLHGLGGHFGDYHGLHSA